MLARFGTGTETALHENVARALYNKGLALSKLGLNKEAIASYDDLVARFGTANSGFLRDIVRYASQMRQQLHSQDV